MQRSSVPSRREFVAALAVIASGTAAPIVAQDAKLPDAAAYSEALEVVVRYRFGKHLSEAQIKKVHASVLRGRGNADAMKKIELANSEDPIAAFSADLP